MLHLPFPSTLTGTVTPAPPWAACSGRRGQLPPCHNLLSGYCREWWCLPWASSWWKRHVPVFPWQIAMWDVENSNTAQRFKDVHKKSVSHWKNTCVCTSLFNSVKWCNGRWAACYKALFMQSESKHQPSHTDTNLILPTLQMCST